MTINPGDRVRFPAAIPARNLSGYFQAWSLEYEELNDGVGTYAVAIVLMDDGSVRTPSATDVALDDITQKAES